VTGSVVGDQVPGRRGRAWIRRGILAVVLAAAAFAPYQTSGAASSGCGAARCGTAGTVLWTHRLPGAWTAASNMSGTVPAAPNGEAYAAVGSGVAALGFGLSVYAYSAHNGHLLWATGLSGLPAGAQIVSVRVWPGVVTVGVTRGPLFDSAGGQSTGGQSTGGQGTGGQGTGGQGTVVQSTVVLSAVTGHQWRSYPAAPFGGAVAAGSRDTVVIGPAAVTSYSNPTGRRAWSRGTGSSVQGWRSSGGYLYLAMAPDGSLGTGPVTALRRISLRTGAQWVVRPRGGPPGSFDGTLDAVLRGVALFSTATEVSAYSCRTGRLLWQWASASAVPESVDVVRGVLYLSAGGTVTGVEPVTGRVVATVTGANASGSSGIYGVRDDVALGLDLGPLGDAWGYDVISQRVIWTTRTLPWPHYFVDLSGIGGSADPASSMVLLADCPQRAASGSGCQDPQLVLVSR
jgi:hypothetical protein